MKEMLKENVLPSVELHWDRADKWVLLHDNDKKFCSNLVKEFLHNNCIEVLRIPAYSPDLNPIENLWAILARAVDKHVTTTEEELGDAIVKEWDKVDKTVMENLADSMSKRCEAVVEAEGWHTKY